MQEHIIISKDRSVNVPESIRKIGVQYDHNVNTLTFDCPRYSAGGVDLSTLIFYVNYLLPDSTPGSSRLENVTVDAEDSELIHFDWVIRRTVTSQEGFLKCLVCAKKSDSEGTETNHWNTDLFNTMYVTEGLETEAEIEEENKDLITQLLLEMDTTDENLLNLSNRVGELSNLTTDDKSSIVAAVNEVKGETSELKDDLSQLSEDIGDLYVGNPITIKKVPKNWANGYIDTSGNLIANNTGYITQELISFDEDGYTYSLKDTFEGFVSQFKLWVFIYDLSGNYVSGRNESYAVTNLNDAPKPDTQHKYRFMLSTLNWETFSDSNINADKANTILQIKKEIQNPYAKKENLNKTDENVSVLDGRVTTLENKCATQRTWKKWNAIGDSITFFDGYEPIVKNALGIESYTNNGQRGFSTSMIGKSYIDSMSDDYDLITFFMGTNNFGRCNSIAETKSSCESIFSAMADKWQTSDIAIILPIQRWGYTGDDVKGQQTTMTNSDGITLRDYCLAIKEIAEKYSFCVLDGYYRSGIIGGENGNTSNYLNDGLHPNDKGNELIANMIVKFLKANF